MKCISRGEGIRRCIFCNCVSSFLLMLLLVKVVVVEFEIIGTLAVADVGCVDVGVIANGCGFDLPINLVTRLFCYDGMSIVSTGFVDGGKSRSRGVGLVIIRRSCTVEVIVNIIIW